MKKLPLTQGLFALVDDEDYEWAIHYKWYAFRAWGDTWYAERRSFVDSKELVERGRLHRLIMHAPKGVQVDHKDGDGLNCRRENLRFATNLQNSRNRGKNRNNTSGYKGVYLDPRRGLWKALAQVEGKLKWLGYFPTPEEAAVAYDTFVTENWGEFARVNFA